MNRKKFIYLGSSHKKLDKSSDKITSDCLEAIVGAIYLDGGIKSAEKFIYFFWEEHLLKSVVTIIDSKTKLQEFSLKKFKVLPKYIFSKKTGPQHRPMFKTEVQIPNSKKIIGIGSSKKNAQQDAANKLLKLLDIYVFIGTRMGIDDDDLIEFKIFEYAYTAADPKYSSTQKEELCTSIVSYIAYI